MNFTETITYKIADLATVHRSFLEKKLALTGVHSGQVFILFELWKEDGLSQIELANRLKISAPTVNKMVRTLSDSGFCELRRSDSDGRLVNVYLLKKAADIKPAVEIAWLEFDAETTANLTETEKLIFLQLLEKILLCFYNGSAD